jgi:hypothetical protein
LILALNMELDRWSHSTTGITLYIYRIRTGVARKEIIDDFVNYVNASKVYGEDPVVPRHVQT